VTMSTVGYGDIVPLTVEAKLFMVSIIMLGVAVFATSLTVVIAPMVSTSLQRIVSGKGRHMKREKHFVVIGNTPLATNTWRELARRGRPVTRLLRKPPDDVDLDEVDVVVAPQLLGGELLAMMLTGEEVTSDFVMKSVFRDLSGAAESPGGTGPATA